MSKIKCKYCGKKLVTTNRTNEYRCDRCNRTFKIGGGMYQEVKIESIEEQMQRQAKILGLRI